MKNKTYPRPPHNDNITQISIKVPSNTPNHTTTEKKSVNPKHLTSTTHRHHQLQKPQPHRPRHTAQPNHINQHTQPKLHLALSTTIAASTATLIYTKIIKPKTHKTP